MVVLISKSRTSVFASLGVLTLLLLGGCGGSASAPTSDVVWNQYNAEYFREAHTLRLAPGFVWPKKAPAPKVGPDGSPIKFEKGTGRSHADAYWYCSWERAWIANRVSNPSLARKALAQLPLLRLTHKYRVSNDSAGQRYYDDAIRRAQLGDPSLIEQDVNANCPPPA